MEFIPGLNPLMVLPMFFISPMGVALSTEAIWTTLISPLLIFTYPLSALDLIFGNNQECLQVSDIMANPSLYSFKDFVVQATLKENRLMMWPLIPLQLVNMQLDEALGL